MASWTIDIELQAFSRVECLVQYRITGTWQSRDRWDVDDVCVPAQRGHGDWVRINRSHPFYRSYEAYLNSSAFDRDVDNAILREMEFDYEEVG